MTGQKKNTVSGVRTFQTEEARGLATQPVTMSTSAFVRYQRQQE
jgi:hypothetical protein